MSAAEPGQVVCVDCDFRAADRIERGPDGQVVDAVCERCFGWRGGRAAVPDGTIVIGGVPRAFLKGYMNSEIPG